MVTKRTRLMSAFAAILMLVSMFTAFVLPVSAADYSNEANGYPNFPNASDYASYSSQNHFLVETLADLTAVQGAASSFAGKWIHLAASIDFSSAGNQSMGAQTVNIDGHDYAIRGINLNAGASAGKAWFTTYAGTIQNLVIEGATVSDTVTNSAVLIAQLSGATTLTDVTMLNCTLSNSTANTTNASLHNNNNALVVGTTSSYDLTINNTALIGCTFNKVGSPYGLNSTGFLVGQAKGNLIINGVLMMNNTHSIVKAKVATDGTYKDDGSSSGSNANGLLIGVHEGDGMNVNISNVAVFGTVDATTEEGTVMDIDTFVMDRTKFQGTVNIAVTDENKAAFYTNSDKTAYALPEDVAATNIYSLSDKWLVDDDTKGDDLDINGTAYTLEQIMSADTLAALNTAAGGNTWKTSTVWKDANEAGYPVPVAIEDSYNAYMANKAKETPEYLRAVYVRDYYEPYKEGYAAEFDLWAEGAAMKAAYDAAVAYIADPSAADAATAYGTMQENFKEFAEANGTVNLHLKNEYPYYPKLTDADVYGPALLKKYDTLGLINDTKTQGSTGSAAAQAADIASGSHHNYFDETGKPRDPRVDNDGHLNFRIGSAEEWIELMTDSDKRKYFSGYTPILNNADNYVTSVDNSVAADGFTRVVIHLTDDIEFTTDDSATDLSTYANPTMVLGGGNFTLDGNNHVFKNVNMEISAAGWNGGDRGLIYYGSNNVIYKNFGVASGTINVTGTATGGRLRISPLVAYTSGSLTGMYNCWNAADVNVTATGFTSIYAGAIGNLARDNNNFANCLNLGTITISDDAKATAGSGSAVYSAMATYDSNQSDYDSNTLHNCSSINGGVPALVAASFTDFNAADSTSKFFDADATMGEIAYHMNANFHETAGILNNANNTTSHAAYSRLNLIRPNYTLVGEDIAYGTAANAVRKVVKQNCDSLGNPKDGEDPVLVGYYNGNATVEVPAADTGYTFSAEKTGVTLNGNSFTMAGADVTLKYVDDSVDTAVIEEIYNDWAQYDQKLFDTASAAAIKAVVDEAAALLEKDTVTSGEVTALQANVEELEGMDLKLNYTYPNYVPYSKWQLYEKFGLEDASDNNHVKFAIGSAEEAKYVMDNYYIGTFLNTAKINDGSETLTAAYGGTVGWDQASKDPVMDGSYRVEFHMTADIDLGAYTGASKLTKNFDMQQTMFYGHKHVFKNIEIDLGSGTGGFFGNGNNCVIMDVGLANGTIKGATVASFRTGAQGWGSYIINSWSALDLTGANAAYGFSNNIIQSRDLIENSAFVGTLDAPTVYLTSGRPGSGDGDGYTGAPAHVSAFYTDDYAWSPQHAAGSGIVVSDNALETGELAYKMNKSDHEGYREDSFTWDAVTKAYYTMDANGNMVYGTEANSVRKVTIQLKDAIGQLENTFEEYKNGDAANVALNTYDGYAISAADCVNATVDAGTYTLEGKDATLVYKSTAIGTAGAQAIYDEWSVYDQDLFTTASAAAIKNVVDTADAIIKAGSTTQDALDDLVAAEAALDPKLNYTYPTYVPVDEYATYEKFGLQDTDGIIYLAIDDAAALKFARDDAKFASGVASGSGFLASVTDGAGTTYASKYGSGDADAASKANGDGKYRVRFVLTDDIDMTGYTFTGTSTWNANSAFLGYNHVISNVKMELTGTGSFFRGHNGYIADVGVQGSITTTDETASIGPMAGFGGGNGHLRNCWFDIDLTGGANRYAIAAGMGESSTNVSASNIVNVASFGTGANYVFGTGSTSCGVKGIYYPDGVTFASNGVAESGTTKLTATAGESGELAYLLNNADYSSNNAALGTYYYGDDYATKLATYYDVVDGKFAFSATNPEYCRIELINTAGNKTLYAKKNTTITLNYAEGLECEYTVISGTSTLSGENNDQLLVLDDTSITVTLTGIVTDVLEAAVTKYNGLNVGYFVNKTSGENDLADQIAAANAIIDGTNEDAEQDDVNALATLIADGYQLDDYPNIPKVSELAAYKDFDARDFLVANITDLNDLAADKANFTKDYTVHFAENVVIEVGTGDAANNMSGMNANIDGHGATIKGVTFSLTAADGTAAWLGVYGGSKISNLVLDSWNTTFTGWKSGVLIANSSVALTLENITIKDCTASYGGNYGGFLLADYNGSALTLTNITVEGSTMTHASGNNGLLVGRVNTGTFTAENLYLNGNTITHTSGIAGGRGVIFGEENATTATISNVIVLNTTFGEGHVYTSGNIRMGVIVGRHKVNALTVRNAIVVLGDYKNQELPIINCDGIDSNGTVFNTPTYTLENIYSDAKYENYVTGNTATSYSLVENSNVIDTAKLLNGYATNALNLANDADIWTMVGNAADGYEPAFITGSEKATVAVSFTSDSWLAGEGGLTYTYYTDSTGKLIGVAEADVVALKKVDNWTDLDAAVLATYDAATTISGTYEGEEHTHKYGNLVPNADGEHHSGECIEADCPWYDNELECTFNQYAHNDNTTYDGSAHSVSCLCGNEKDEPEACKDDATPVTSDPAECDNPGSETYLCNKCGETFVKDIPALDHEYADNDWTPDAEKGYHTHNCKNGCGTPEREQCNYQESGRTNAQVGVPGEIQYTCTKCGDTKTEPIPAQMGLVLTASGAAYVGRTVSVKTELAGNPGLRGLAVSYGYDASIYTYTDAVYGNIPGEDVRWEVSQPSAPDGDGYTWITITFTTTADSGFTGEEVMTVNFTVADEVNASESYIYAKVEAEGAVNTENEFVDVPGTYIEIPVSEVLFGDFYANGEVNLIDVVMMLRYTVGRADVLEKVTNGECSLDAFDVNEDGDYTVDDVLIVLKEVNDRLNNQAAGK